MATNLDQNKQATADSCFAVVDIGSNGVRFAIHRVLISPHLDGLAHYPLEYEERAPISLFAAQRGNSPVSLETLNQLRDALIHFQRVASRPQFNVRPEDARVIATEATRIAPNSAEILETIHSSLNPPWRIDVLSQDDEARFGVMGVLAGLQPQLSQTVNRHTIIVDMGGGSIQFSVVHGGQVAHSVSLPLGTAAIQSQLGAETDAATTTASSLAASSGLNSRLTDALRDAQVFQRCTESTQRPQLLVTGGGFTRLARVLAAKRVLPFGIVHGANLPVTSLFEHAQAVAQMTAQQLTKFINGSLSTRASALLAPACIMICAIQQTMMSLGCHVAERVVIAETGARLGAIVHLRQSQSILPQQPHDTHSVQLELADMCLARISQRQTVMDATVRSILCSHVSIITGSMGLSAVSAANANDSNSDSNSNGDIELGLAIRVASAFASPTCISPFFVAKDDLATRAFSLLLPPLGQLSAPLDLPFPSANSRACAALVLAYCFGASESSMKSSSLSQLWSETSKLVGKDVAQWCKCAGRALGYLANIIDEHGPHALSPQPSPDDIARIIDKLKTPKLKATSVQ
ncbi:actin-like ATPase domain-containing protein [Ramicandelaber brevisporus]|nr:actin-like ATPase domain-containing protein [Ramicandelaber brevisporus]